MYAHGDCLVHEHFAEILLNELNSLAKMKFRKHFFPCVLTLISIIIIITAKRNI